MTGEAGENIGQLVGTLRGRINGFILARLADEGITELAPSHGSILVALYRDGPQAMTALSGKVGRDKSTLTVLVRKLESLGYVRREADARDSRVSIVRLTEKGNEFRALFERVSGELIGRVWGETPEEERGVICAALARMAERL